MGDLYNDDDSDNRRSDATWNWKRIDCILICFTSDQSCRCSSRRVDLSGEKLDKNFDESFVPGKTDNAGTLAVEWATRVQGCVCVPTLVD